jgi:hypothetical protein
MEEEEVRIPKTALLCDVCNDKLTEEKIENGKQRYVMRKDAILTDWGLYCVKCFLRYCVKIKSGVELYDHIEGGTDVTDSELMKPITLKFF